MPKVKYGTEEYRNAYNKRSLANYDFNSKTYNLARPLPDIVATPKNNLDLGQVVRNGTSKIGKPIGVAITELAALHPMYGDIIEFRGTVESYIKGACSRKRYYNTGTMSIDYQLKKITTKC